MTCTLFFILFSSPRRHPTRIGPFWLNGCNPSEFAEAIIKTAATTYEFPVSFSRHSKIKRLVLPKQNVCPGQHVLSFAAKFTSSGHGPNCHANSGGNAGAPNGHASSGAKQRPTKFRGRRCSLGAAVQSAQHARTPILLQRPSPRSRPQTVCATWCLSYLIQLSPASDEQAIGPRSNETADSDRKLQWLAHRGVPAQL